MKAYTAEQENWIINNCGVKEWKNMKEFTDSFNSTFNTDKTECAIQCWMQRRNLEFVSKGGRYTQEQKKWIEDNAQIMEWRNIKHFTDTFNAIFNVSTTKGAMITYLYKHKITISAYTNTDHYTEEMDKWLSDNYAKYDNDWVALARDFNSVFNVAYSNCRLTKHCQRKLKIHIPKRKEKGKTINKGSFTKGNNSSSTKRQLPIGTIRTYTSKTSRIPMIKVKLCEGDSGSVLGGNGHNMKRPWWIPLKEKVWTDAYGEIPEGYRIIHLDHNTENCELSNLALADARGLAIMGSHKWWSDNPKFTATAVEWCNLYMVAKDNKVLS